MAEDAGSIYAEVRIRLNQLDNDVKQATARLDGLERDTKASSEKASKEVSKNYAAIGVAAVAMSAVVIGAFRALITSSSTYSEALAGVRAATRGSAEDLENLAAAAETSGKAVAASSTEALDAIEALSKAGVSNADIMGGALTGALTLAAAGEMQVADAAEIAAATMTQFGLAGEDVTHIADLLAAGAGKAQGEVSDLSEALKQAGLVASQTGLSVDDTVGSLAAFASAGLLGSDAGTSFRTMLLRLTPQSKEAAEEMKRLGINAFDASGEFIGITKFAGQLQDQLKGLTTEQRNAALATIFGTDSIRAANVLYTQGAEGIGEWIDKVNDSGFAADTARIRLDSLSGDLKQLDAQIATSSAKIGGSLDPTLRGLAQAGTKVLDWLDEMPAPIAAFVTAAGTVAAVITAITLGVGFLTPALAALGITLSASFGPVSLIIGGVAALAAGAVAAGNAMGIFSAKTEVSAESIKKSSEKIKLANENIKKFGLDINTLSYDVQVLNQKLKDLSKFDGKVLKLDIRNPKDALKLFTQIGDSVGITAEQVARIAVVSDFANETVKKYAQSFVDASEKAKTASATVVNSFEDQYGAAGEAWEYQTALMEEFYARDAEALAQKEQDEKDAYALQNALLDEFTARDAEALAQKERDEKDAWAYQTELMEEFYDRDEEERKKQLEGNKELARAILDTFSGLTTALADIFASLYGDELDALDERYERERELVENNGLTKKQALEKELADAIAAGDTEAQADAQKQLELYTLEQEYAKKKAKLEYEAALTQWKFQVAQSSATVAQAAVNAYASAMTTGPFALVTLGAYLAALAPLAGLIGTITAAQPEPPKFATGGIVLPSGNSGKQVTVADQGGGELMFGTGALGQPLMQGFIKSVADEVVSRLSGMGKPLTMQIDGQIFANTVVRYIDNGKTKMKGLVK